MTTRLRGWVQKIGLSLLVFVMALCLAEIGLRVFNYKPPLSSQWLVNTTTRVLDPEVLTIDRTWLDDSFYLRFENPGTSKVVVALGDSFTFGFPVTSARSYPKELEHLLRDEAYDVRVMNAGMSDSGPDQQFKLFTRYILPRVKPDIVIWQFYPNDTVENAMKPLFDIGEDGALIPIGVDQNWMYRRQRFYDRIPLPRIIKTRSYLVNLFLRRYEYDLYARVPSGRDRLEWGRQKIALEIDRMNALAATRGFRVYYALVAPQSTYRDAVAEGTTAATEAIEYRELLKILEKQPTFVHGRFAPASLDGNEDLGTDLFAEERRDPSPAGTRHLNERGYSRLARRVAERVLIDAGWTSIPSIVAPTPLYLRFGTDRTRQIMRTGWQEDASDGRTTYVWSDGMESVVEVPLPTEGDVRMDFECQPIESPDHIPQAVAIVLNGTPIERVTLQPTLSTYSVILPREQLRDPPNTIALRYAYTRPYKDIVPGSTDPRTLAVLWLAMNFTPTPTRARTAIP